MGCPKQSRWLQKTGKRMQAALDRVTTFLQCARVTPAPPGLWLPGDQGSPEAHAGPATTFPCREGLTLGRGRPLRMRAQAIPRVGLERPGGAIYRQRLCQSSRRAARSRSNGFARRPHERKRARQSGSHGCRPICRSGSAVPHQTVENGSHPPCRNRMGKDTAFLGCSGRPVLRRPRQST